MPKPFLNRTGSGTHFHVSIGDSQTNNLFCHANDSNGLATWAPVYRYVTTKRICSIFSLDSEVQNKN